MYNVLVCDDDREIVEAIEIYLSQEGYKVLKAYDGEEALKVLDREKVDLLTYPAIPAGKQKIRILWNGNEEYL